MEQLQVFKGTEITFTLPSGNVVTIREQSAADDDILTASRKGGDPLDSLNRFILAIITQYKGSPSVTLEDILNMKLRDKYYILLKTRMHSIGDELIFKHKCENEDCGHESEWEENLKDFDRDYSTDEPGGPKSVEPYEKGDSPDFLITLQSGKVFKLDHLNGNGEKFALRAAKNSSISKNTDLFARNIRIRMGEEYVALSSVNILSKRESIELSAQVLKKDPQFLLGSEITCPNCGREEFLSFIAITDFFFPVGI